MWSILTLYSLLGGLLGLMIWWVGDCCHKKVVQRRQTAKRVLRLVDAIDKTESVVRQIIHADGTFLGNIDRVRSDLRSLPENEMLNVILSTPGGALFNCSRLIRLLKSRPGGYRVFIRKYAMSAGTLIALGAREIVMTNDDSFLGKIDPSCGGVHMIHVLRAIDAMEASQSKLTMANRLLGQKATDMKNEMDAILTSLDLNSTLRTKIEAELIFSNYPHEHKFDFAACRALGLNVRLPEQSELEYFD